MTVLGMKRPHMNITIGACEDLHFKHKVLQMNGSHTQKKKSQKKNLKR